MAKFVYSSSPHVKTPLTTRRIMIEVAIALLPACIVGIVYFGLVALLTLAIATLAAVLSEVVYRLCQKVLFKTILKEFDFTSVVTGLLVGMNMPANIAWYVPLLASIFAIVIVKMVFGGTGRNIVNPAIAGRVFAIISFAGLMTTYPSANVGSLSGGFISSGATPLGALYNPDLTNTLTNLDLFLGVGVPGVIGETCKAALLLGGIYLCARGIINFRWPIVYIAVTGLFTVALNGFDFNYFLPSILSGGLFLGAIFMATDYVTSPTTKLGNYIYFVLLGLLTAGMRQIKGTEMVSYCILFMNLFVPLIDKYIVKRPFGYQKPVKVKEDK